MVYLLIVELAQCIYKIHFSFLLFSFILLPFLSLSFSSLSVCVSPSISPFIICLSACLYLSLCLSRSGVVDSAGGVSAELFPAAVVPSAHAGAAADEPEGGVGRRGCAHPPEPSGGPGGRLQQRRHRHAPVRLRQESSGVLLHTQREVTLRWVAVAFPHSKCHYSQHSPAKSIALQSYVKAQNM